MPKRGKRAAGSHVDWIISLGIFLMYIAWFFVYVNPLVSRPVEAGPLMSDVVDRISSNVTWQVYSVPVIVFSNISGNNEPVIVNFPYSWNSSSFSFADNTSFLLDGKRLLFLANLSAGKKSFEIAHSSENYTQSSPANLGLVASYSHASVGTMDAEFSSSVLDKASYEGSYRLREFNVSIDSLSLPVGNRTTTFIPLVASYGFQGSSINHTMYVFAGNTRIYGFVDSNNPLETKINFSVSATLSNLTSYYDGSAAGELNFNNSCRDFLSNYMDFYDANSGMTFIFKDAANISICRNASITFSAFMLIGSSSEYDILFHKGSYNNTIGFVSPYKARFGIVEKQEGFSSRFLTSLNSSDYSSLKERWGISNDFSYAVVNSSNSELFMYQPSSPGLGTNIFVREIERSMIDQYGGRQKVTLRVKGW